MTAWSWLLVLGATAGLAYWFLIRKIFRTWGAGEIELQRVMPGDTCVDQPTYEATLAISIQARPRHIWPWLLQMGCGRGGLYSYDWLDQLFGYLDRPSANHILPEFQRLRAGDVIPLGRGPGFPVRLVQPDHSLVLAGEQGGFAWSWEFGLYQTADQRTTLVSRSRASMPRTLRSLMLRRLLEPAAFLMTRRMLRGLRSRAESLASSESGRIIRAA
jgi:hypothetical protein